MFSSFSWLESSRLTCVSDICFFVKKVNGGKNFDKNLRYYLSVKDATWHSFLKIPD